MRHTAGVDQQRLTVTDDAERSRYRIDVDGAQAGFAAYVRRDDVVTFTHTEIDAAWEGQGVGSALARAALDDVRAHARRVRPLCPFIARWIGTHPDYQDLVVR